MSLIKTKRRLSRQTLASGFQKGRGRTGGKRLPVDGIECAVDAWGATQKLRVVAPSRR